MKFAEASANRKPWGRCGAYIDGMSRAPSPTVVGGTFIRSREDCVRAVRFRTTNGRPYDGGGQTKRMPTKRRITSTDVRYRGGGNCAREYRKSTFREAYEAAKSRRLPRGRMDIGSGAAPGAAFEPRECVSTRLFPRSGIQWRHFWFRLFREKAE